MNRCGNCLAPYQDHTPRMAAPPLCSDGRDIYREGTVEELSAAYRAKFGDGPPRPIATFRLDNPADVERARSVLSPAALTEFFRDGGTGMSGLMEAIEKMGK